MGKTKGFLKVEHELYPQVIKSFCEEGMAWRNNHLKIEGKLAN